MPFKFEQLDVWRLSLDYLDLMYTIADKLPKSEEFNLRSQLRRAATSVALNIAEGSTSQSDPEQARFLSMALRSLLETVACQHIIARRGLLTDPDPLRQAYRQAEALVARLHSFRQALVRPAGQVREEQATYLSASYENMSDLLVEGNLPF